MRSDRMSYCDNCIHAHVCRHVKKVKEYEGRIPETFGTEGVTVRYAVNCVYKEEKQADERERI